MTDNLYQSDNTQPERPPMNWVERTEVILGSAALFGGMAVFIAGVDIAFIPAIGGSVLAEDGFIRYRNRQADTAGQQG